MLVLNLILLIGFVHLLEVEEDLKLGIPTTVYTTTDGKLSYTFDLKVSSVYFHKYGQTLTFTTTPFSGDPDMYISSSSGKTWNSTHRGGIEIVSIEYTSDWTDETYEITVEGYGGYCAFSVVSFIFEDGMRPVVLYDGQSQLSRVSDEELMIFHFDISDQSKTVSISSSNIDSGDVDVCVTFNPIVPLPDFSNCVYRSLLPGSDVLEFNPSSDSVNIGIKNYRSYGSTVFNIVTSQSKSIRIPDSYAVREMINTDVESKVFSFYNSKDHDDLRIELIRRSAKGDVDLYVGFGYIPTKYHYDHYSIRSGGNLDICEFSGRNGWYFITVERYSKDDKVVFDISANSLEQHMVISPGYTYRGLVKQNKVRYFEVYQASMSTNSLEIFLFSDVGPNDMYVSVRADNPYPTKQSYDYQGKMLSFDQRISSIHIPAGILEAPSWIFVAGYFNDSTTFEINAQLSSSRSYLYPGSVMLGSAAFGEYTFYASDIGKQVDGDVVIVAKMLGGAACQMYVSLDGVDPTTSHFDYTNSTTAYGTNTIEIPRSRFTKNFGGVIGIGIYGQTRPKVYYDLKLVVQNVTTTESEN